MSFRNIDSIWQDFWLLLMVLWKRALTMTVSDNCEHFVFENLSCGVCFLCDRKKYALHQLDREILQNPKSRNRPASSHLRYFKEWLIWYCSVVLANGGRCQLVPAGASAYLKYFLHVSSSYCEMHLFLCPGKQWDS